MKRTLFPISFLSAAIVKLYHELCNSIEANHLKVPSSKIICHDSCWWSENPFSLKGGAEWGSTVWVSGDVVISNQRCCFSVTKCGLTASTQANACGRKASIPRIIQCWTFCCVVSSYGQSKFHMVLWVTGRCISKH